MSERRFFIPAVTADVFPAPVVVSDPFVVDHIRKVLRLKPGDAVTAVDSVAEIAYRAEIARIDKDAVTLLLKEPLPAVASRLPDITLVAAMIKEQRWDWLLQKATELGVRRIIPVIARHGVVRIKDAAKKRQRWQAVVTGAARQAEGLFVPEVSEPVDVALICRTLVTDSLPGAVMVARGEARRPFARFLSTRPERLAVAIGPEGGWHPDEVAIMTASGFEAVSLGDRILRSETAAIAALGAIAYAYDATD